MSMYYQYEMMELEWKGQEPRGSFVEVDLEAVFSQGEEQTHVKGFYAGDDIYKVRFLPLKEGNYTYQVHGAIEEEGTF